MNDPREYDLSRIYSEGAWPEPRKQIDDAILEASRRAARARHPLLHRWGPPFALAATVVLGVSLAVLVSENPSLRDVGGLLRSDEPAARPAPQKKREAAPAAPRADSVQRPQAAPGGDVPTPRELFSSPMGPATPAAKAPAPAAKAPSAAKAPPPVTGTTAPSALAKRAPPAAAPKSPAPQPLAARPAAPAVEAAPASAAAVQAAPVVRSPESWLDDIRKLKTDGRNAEAEREVAEFRRRYPDFRVPEDLR